MFFNESDQCQHNKIRRINYYVPFYVLILKRRSNSHKDEVQKVSVIFINKACSHSILILDRVT